MRPMRVRAKLTTIQNGAMRWVGAAQLASTTSACAGKRRGRPASRAAMGEVAFPGSDRWALDCAAVGVATGPRWALGCVAGLCPWPREVLSQPVD